MPVLKILKNLKNDVCRAKLKFFHFFASLAHLSTDSYVFKRKYVFKGFFDTPQNFKNLQNLHIVSLPYITRVTATKEPNRVYRIFFIYIFRNYLTF